MQELEDLARDLVENWSRDYPGRAAGPGGSQPVRGNSINGDPCPRLVLALLAAQMPSNCLSSGHSMYMKRIYKSG